MNKKYGCFVIKKQPLSVFLEPIFYSDTKLFDRFIFKNKRFIFQNQNL
nr:MAG TPA: hypothetical protein [Caudoviricetes sp.]